MSWMKVKHVAVETILVSGKDFFLMNYIKEVTKYLHIYIKEFWVYISKK